MNIWTIIMLLAIIIFVIVPSFKPRTMPVKKLLIMPAIFMYLLYNSLTHNFPLTSVNAYVVILLGAVAGILTGIALRCRVKVKADHDKELMWMPGSYVALFTFVTIFAVHFVIGYIQAVKPELLIQENQIELILLFLLTAVSCMTVGISSTLYYKYKQSPQLINDTRAA